MTIQLPLHRNVVVIGASAGGIEALEVLVNGLPQDFPASLFVVVHLSADSPGALPGIYRPRLFGGKPAGGHRRVD